MRVKLEVFTAEPPCAGCVHLLQLADEVAQNYAGRVEVVKHVGPCEEFENYGLTVVPAVVLNEGRIKIMGVCPSRKTLEATLKELGV